MVLLSQICVDLPEHLAERCRILKDGEQRADGRFVLAWLHHAVRSRENAVVDAAIGVANALGVPVLVYHGLGGRHRFNSDRHHVFIMEGARDAAAGLRERGVGYAFHLPTTHDEASPLRALADQAAAFVVEDYPAPPFPQWTRALADRASCPVVAVDADCIVPMRMIEQRHERAFKFRNAAKKLYKARVEREWRDLDVERRWDAGTDLPFKPVDIERADVIELASRCAIDHTLPPVPELAGGERAALDRWRRYRDDGLERYHRTRNDAARHGVSRLSPYLHHGHIASTMLAREASRLRGEGPEKFIDELFVWRELAHHFCYRTPDDQLETLDAIPDWARRTLSQHANDPRPDLPSWERLARARTGDELWDLCQTSLLVRGELHNNLRMTWGKAILDWTRGPSHALDTLIDLNHRFALDGNDPNSYGGLLWCLGQFDRPFEEQPIIGTLRERTTEVHARRLDIKKYANKVCGPATRWPKRIGVIGGGIAGLACARTLADQGYDVRVFDKGRGPGGRASTRHHDDHRFDHGAAYFTVRDERFRRYVDSWIHDDLAARWTPRIVSMGSEGVRPVTDARPLYVGIPGMNALCAHLARDVEVSFGTRITAVEREGDSWRLRDRDDALDYRCDALVTALPAPQGADLLADAHPELAQRARVLTMLPCWTVMLAQDRTIDVDFDLAFIDDGGPLEKAIRDTSKPDRPDGADRWTFYATHEWTAQHLEEKPDTVAQLLLEAFGERAGKAPDAPLVSTAHRWLYAKANDAVDDGAWFDAETALALCGDWLSGNRIEGAFLSGVAAAGRVMGEAVRRARADDPAAHALFA
jgi:photolyase PhrII